MTTLLQVIADGQAQLAEAQQELRGMVARIITAIEAQATPAATVATPAPEKPRIATYAEMYGPIVPDPEPPWTPRAVPRRRGWQRWFVREDQR
jgi:hypothetical protein